MWTSCAEQTEDSEQQPEDDRLTFAGKLNDRNRAIRELFRWLMIVVRARV